MQRGGPLWTAGGTRPEEKRLAAQTSMKGPLWDFISSLSGAGLIAKQPSPHAYT